MHLLEKNVGGEGRRLDLYTNFDTTKGLTVRNQELTHCLWPIKS